MLFATNLSKIKTGILLTNIGSPDAPRPAAVRRYLREFLSDRRIVELPRILWLPLLYGIILPFRSRASAKLYQNIWMDSGKGAPLVFHTENLAQKLRKLLKMPVVAGMHYGHPSMAKSLEILRAEQLDQLIVLPLFPQYSATSTGSSFDRAQAILKKWRVLPSLQFVSGYATHPAYINAICNSVRAAFAARGEKFLLFSFHGIPEKYVERGDPYPVQCRQTVQQITGVLGLAENEYALTFQSRLGRSKWLTPYTDVALKALPARGVRDIAVICPGFAVDCLETLEEIAIRGREQFMEAGGNSFDYIPALNDEVSYLAEILRAVLPG